MVIDIRDADPIPYQDFGKTMSDDGVLHCMIIVCGQRLYRESHHVRAEDLDS